MTGNKKIPLSKKIIQGIITVLLVALIYDMIVIIGGIAEDDYRDDRMLERDLAYGEYGDCVDYYDVVKFLYGDEEIDKVQYDRYTEFVDFYENYMHYIQCEAYDEYKETDKYVNERETCLERMLEISGNTQFYENEPHYEYLLETIQGEQ